MLDFSSLLPSDNGRLAVPLAPFIGLVQAGRAGFFDYAGYLVSSVWDTIDFSNLGDANAYALDICGDSMEPIYREGDIVIVSPNAAVLIGDRVVATPSDMKFWRRNWSTRP